MNIACDSSTQRFVLILAGDYSLLTHMQNMCRRLPLPQNSRNSQQYKKRLFCWTVLLESSLMSLTKLWGPRPIQVSQKFWQWKIILSSRYLNWHLKNCTKSYMQFYAMHNHLLPLLFPITAVQLSLRWNFTAVYQSREWQRKKWMWIMIYLTTTAVCLLSTAVITAITQTGF